MKIAIDISQIVYEGTGVAEYVRQLVLHLLSLDSENDYILFFSHLRAEKQLNKFKQELAESSVHKNYQIKRFRIPLFILEWLWNTFHVLPIELFIGNVDVVYTSDWVESPVSKAKKITTIHDLSVLKMP